MPVLPAINECPNTYPPHDQVSRDTVGPRMPPRPVPTRGNDVVVAAYRHLVDNRPRWPGRNSAPVLPASCLPLVLPFRHRGYRTMSWEVSFQNVPSSTEKVIRPFLLQMARTGGLAL